MSPDRSREKAAHEVDLIAPWRAAGRLDAKDSALLDALLKDDPDLVRRLDAAEDERDATWELNEALPTPSAKARDALFARIEAHEAKRLSVKGLGRWLSETIAATSPQALAWSAVAAALVIAVQGGFLTKAYLGGEGGAQLAAVPGDHGVAVSGQTILVGFAPTATAGQIATLLKDAKAEIVGGPKPGGVFVVRIADKPLAQDKLDAALKALRSNAVVTFANTFTAAPAQ